MLMLGLERQHKRCDRWNTRRDPGYLAVAYGPIQKASSSPDGSTRCDSIQDSAQAGDDGKLAISIASGEGGVLGLKIPSSIDRLDRLDRWFGGSCAA